VLPEADLLGCYAPTLGHGHVLVDVCFTIRSGYPVVAYQLALYYAST